MMLALRFSPPIGGVLYWLRPGHRPAAAVAGQGAVHARLPPHRPSTSRCMRAVLAASASSCSPPTATRRAFRLDTTWIAVLLGLLALLGLRDKVPFLAARPEIYGFILLVSLFPAEDLIPGWQFVFFFIWWGAAASKLNRHFPFVIQVMISNTPWNRSRKFKSKMYRDYPDDLRPSARAALGAHLGTAWEFGMPLVLLLSDGGTIGTIALVGMLMFHVHIFSTFAMGVPMEWNLFMLFGLCFLFGEYGDYPLGNLDHPLLVAAAHPDRRGHAGRRQPAARQDLVPAVDALLRGQLGHDHVAVPQGHGRGGEVRPRDLQGRADRGRAAREDATTRTPPTTSSRRGSPSARCTATAAR